jgi:hypothetical protein
VRKPKKVYAWFTQVYAGLRSLRPGQLADGVQLSKTKALKSRAVFISKASKSRPTNSHGSSRLQ